MAHDEEALAQVREERVSGVILKSEQKEAIKSFLAEKRTWFW